MAHSFRDSVVSLSGEYETLSQEFMLADLARSGLVPEDMGCTADKVLPEMGKEAKRLIKASYFIPFYDLNGEVLTHMWRKRVQLVAGAERFKIGKYTQPSILMAEGQAHHPYMPPVVWQMERDGVLHLCEGEKKTAAVIKLGHARAFGLTGKDVSIETVKVLAAGVRKLGDVARVCIWPDADVARFDVQKSYGKLRSRLIAELYDMVGLEVIICRPAWDVRVYKGIDDALAAGWEFVVGEEVGDELPIDMRALADEIGLDYSVGAKGDRFEVEINEHNIIKILGVERLWGVFSLNSDNGKWMLGGADLDPNLHVVEFLTRLQGVFGLRKAKYELVYRCIDHMCRGGKESAWARWLEGLTWDGVSRLSGWMSEYCGADAGDSFVEEAGAKFLTSIVARTFVPGCKVDWMMIMAGPQGCGKSSVIGWLLPEEFRRLSLLAPGAHDKDLAMAMAMGRIVCFDEMAVFFKRAEDREFIKQFVTTTVDVCRPPYGRVVEAVERGSVLFGNTDKPDEIIKSDPAGYRRWVIVSVRGVREVDGCGDQFDWEGLDLVREQLWAEAVALWRGGLDVSQVRGAGQRVAERYVTDDPVDFDYFITVLRRLRIEEKLKPDLGHGVRVSVPEFALAYKETFGREPYQPILTAFWKKWDCNLARSNGVRVRTLSTELLQTIQAA